MASPEEERRQLNQLARETLLLKADVDNATAEFTKRFDHIKKQTDELWEDIDQKLDG